jgi:hypothetical protein
MLVVGGLAAKNWPYRHREVLPLLDEVFVSQITMERYHRTYFPRPGFVASGLTLRRKTADPTLPPFGTAKDLIVQGSWLDLLLLRHRVELVDVVGLHLVVPPAGSAERQREFPPGSIVDFSGPTTTVGRLQIRDSVLELQRQGGGSLSFQVKKLVVRELKSGQSLRYALEMQNPMPEGRIVAQGTFGPINTNDLGQTPLSGDFRFDQVQLSDIGKHKGELTSGGRFSGTLQSVNARATTDTPAFAIAEGRPLDVAANVQCTINGLNGDVMLETVQMKMGTTPVEFHGSVAGDPKVTNLDVSVGQGRAQDLLGPFLHKRPPIAGDVSLQGHMQILASTPGAGFLDRLVVHGRFAVADQQLTSKTEEQKLSAFSQRASGAKDPKSTDKEAADGIDVLSSLAGPVTIRAGVVSTDGLHFAVNGASADLKGTYRFKRSVVRLDGILTMDTDLSHVTTGFKSALLKPLAPFFKKGNKGAVVPIAITGSDGKFNVDGNFLHTK